VSGSGPRLDTKVNRGVAWSAAAQAVIALTDLLSTAIVLAFWVGSDDMGIAASALVFYPLLDTAADFGVTSSLIQRDDHTPERVSTVFWFNVLISTGLFLILLAIVPLVGWLFVAYGGKLIFQNVYAIPFAMLRKELRFSEIAKARMIAHLAESIGRIVYAMLGLTVWCWVLAALTRAFVFGVIMQIWHPFRPKWVFRPAEVSQYIRFGLRTAASQILYRFYTSIDQPIVAHAFGKAAAGIYYVATFVVLEPVKTISNVVIDVAFPAFARLRHEKDGLARQFIQLTRLNLIAVLPFVVLILLVIPEALHVFQVRAKWTPAELGLAADAARILCVIGMLRALGFLGPPLLDGIGRPELTLRYMIVAAVAVPGSFLLAAYTLGDRMGLLSVALAWAVGYPIAFLVLSYLVAKTIALPLGPYLRGAWGIVGCCLAGLVGGLGVSVALADAGDLVRMLAIGGTSLVVTIALLATWQHITPRSIAASLKG
jgi:O-antigen/teichoic acid export membrane protein